MKETTLLLSCLPTRRACLRAAMGILAALAFGHHPLRAAVTEAWVHRYIGPWGLNDIAQAVAVDGSGNVVVTGLTDDYGPAYEVDESPDYYTAKYAAADGALLWEKRYNGPANSHDFPSAIAVDGSGNVVVTGSSGYDYYTAKYAAADGALLWERRYNGPANGVDGAEALAVDGRGNVLVTGFSDNGTESICYTAKYAAVNGELLWEKRGPGGGTALAVDGSGNVLVTGDSWRRTDYYTAKYAEADGALLWEKRGPRGGATALAVDSSGNVLVTGLSYASESGNDYYTAKYAAANGALLWEQRYNGPTNSHDVARAVAVDGSDNVVVTGDSGYSFQNQSEADYYSAKYSSADGALLWDKRGPGGGATALAVDGSGNVVVTGSSDDDYYTAEYAAADGALLWEKRYNGPGYASSLALGPNGMVAVTGSSSGDYATVVYRDIPPVSFAAWAACSGLSGVAAAGDADPDSDGIPNSAEYILGGNPTVPGTSRSPTATASGSNMILTFPRADESETPDVILTVESGTDLLTWPAVFNIGPNTAASSPGVSISKNGAAPDTITVTIPQGKATRLFARLKVTIAP